MQGIIWIDPLLRLDVAAPCVALRMAIQVLIDPLLGLNVMTNCVALRVTIHVLIDPLMGSNVISPGMTLYAAWFGETKLVINIIYLCAS